MEDYQMKVNKIRRQRMNINWIQAGITALITTTLIHVVNYIGNTFFLGA